MLYDVGLNEMDYTELTVLV